jgi:hypothetical protein
MTIVDICMRVMGGLLTSVAVLQLVGLPSYYRSEVAFEANAISVPGTVIKTREKREINAVIYGAVSSTTYYISTVEFQTQQGKSVKFTTRNACSSQRDCEKKKVWVKYDPRIPDEARIYLESTPEFRANVRGFFWLIFFSIGIWGLVIYPAHIPLVRWRSLFYGESAKK